MPKLIIKTRQSSNTKMGCCYGYSSFWAKGKLVLTKTTQNNNNEIPLTQEIFDEQWSQYFPSEGQRLLNFYIDYWHKNDFINDVKKGLANVNDAVVIGYQGLIFGHALAIKKIAENKYQYFDCNEGLYEFDGNELDNLFTDYIFPVYQKMFYGLVLDYLPANKDISQGHGLENVIATAYVGLCKIISAPIGIFKHLQPLLELICLAWSRMLDTSSTEVNQDESLLL